MLDALLPIFIIAVSRSGHDLVNATTIWRFQALRLIAAGADGDISQLAPPSAVSRYYLFD